MRLASLFSDRAVLQRGKSVPVWGWTKPGVEVVVSLGGTTARCVAGDDGKFLVRLPALDAGGPFVLTARSEEGEASALDVWIGEVWLASGQSNMELKVAEARPVALEELGAGDQFRMICVPKDSVVHGTRSDIETSWSLARGKELEAFSAVGAWFAKSVAQETGVKVGIINASYGGSIIEAWSSRETLVANPAAKPLLESYEAKLFAGGAKTVQGPFPDPGNEGFAKGWASPDFDASAWRRMELPCVWTGAGLPFSGLVWFRKEVDLPPSWAGKELVLSIGAVDKQDISYFNGEEVGRTGKNFEETHWNEIRRYPVPGRLTKAGRNVIAVRAYSFLYDGGMTGPAEAMAIHPKGRESEGLKLAGAWSFSVERNLGGTTPFNCPHLLYDNMIAPLIPYALRGALWYQGESNGSSADGYRELLTGMTRHLRNVWGQGEFPFYIVQLANYGSSAADCWVKIRDAQLKTALSEPESGLVVTIDVGEDNDIHPKDKRTVGTRLARWALANVYGKQIEPSGPLFKSASVEGARIRVEFSHAGSGLESSDGKPLRTFEIAGADGLFLPAEAKLEGACALLSSPDCPEPRFARYAWSANPKCNLRNKEGLPASPFQT